MRELKTLKDIENDCKYKVNDGFEILEIIRQEAIKWVNDKMVHDARCAFIEFFNITEEELKD